MLAALVALAWLSAVWAYVPAIPINDTSLNLNSSSQLQIQYNNPPGVYGGSVSFQLQADDFPSDTMKGALVHFDESSMGPNQSTSTPWIAYVSCEPSAANNSISEQDYDIFTHAYFRGAVAAVLYTTTSDACLLNPHYINDFEKPLSVFATTSRQVSILFDSQFQYTNSTFLNFNRTLLDMSASDINVTLSGGSLKRKSFLTAILYARNGSAQVTSSALPAPTQPEPQPSQNTRSKAVIFGYVVAGFFGAMMCFTFASVLRRSLQPLPMDPAQPPNGMPQQPRRVGLTQAFLDTFPLVKFSKPSERPQEAAETKDPAVVESTVGMQMSELPKGPRDIGDVPSSSSSFTPLPSLAQQPFVTDEKDSFADARSSLISGTAASIDVLPIAGGDTPSDEQCPICLGNFEEGDDLRVLPCQGQHRFHQACVDPWLLNVSTSCPLCRKDFNPELEAAAVAAQEDEDENEHSANTSGASTPRRGGPMRVSARYLSRIHRARRLRGHDNEESSATPAVEHRHRDRAVSGTSSIMPLRPREADQMGPGGF